MPELLFDHSEELADWAAGHIPHLGPYGSFGPCQAIGVASGLTADDTLYAVVVFHDYQPRARTLQFSAAARSAKWATPGVLRALLHYPFQQLNVYKLWGAIPSDNLRALRFNLGIGMRKEGTLRHHFGERRHAIIVSMLRSEYLHSRWCLEGSERKAA
jgi:RimJ/RimL family protein N-acetyltransferase